VKVEIEIPEDDLFFAAYVLKHLIRGLALGCRPLFVGPNALPSLYSPEAGIRFEEEPTHGSGVERFRLPTEVYRRKRGDCDGLSLYRLAELLAKGEPVDSTIADYLGDGGMHAQVRWLNTRAIEDPAINLGAPYDWPVEFLFDHPTKD
jgi:hypothetical protein